MGPSHRRQLSTEETLAGRDNEEKAVSGRGTICQFLNSSPQDSREGREDEASSVPKEQHSLRTFSDKVSLCSLGKEAVVVGREVASSPGCGICYGCAEFASLVDLTPEENILSTRAWFDVHKQHLWSHYSF